MRRIARLIVLALLTSMLLASTPYADALPEPTGKLSFDLFKAAEREKEETRSGAEAKILSALIVLDQQVTSALLLEIQAAGYQILGSFGQFVSVSAPGDLYLDPEMGIGSIDFITEATTPPATVRNAAQSIPASLPATGATEAHELGYLGSGTRIAIIDEGFDTENSSLLAIQPNLYLVEQSSDFLVPRTYVAASGQVGKQSTHGTACALVAAQIAPEATFFLLSFPEDMGLVGWLWAVDYAVRELKVDVVSSSVEFTRPFCHADGSGLFNHEVTKILRGTDSMLILAAGNWAGGTGTSASFYTSLFSDSDNDYRHDFTPDGGDSWNKNSLAISASSGDRITIILEWDDWGSGTRVQDLDLLLYAPNKKTRIASSRAIQLSDWAGLPPAEMLSMTLPSDGTYYVVIEDEGNEWDGTPACSVSFHLNMHLETAFFDAIEHHLSEGSIRGVASNPNVLSVGAVSPVTGEVRKYSSIGEKTLEVPKPELYAPDGLRNAAIVEGFAGTSASAPYVAGAILLLQSADPDFPSNQIVELLQETSVMSADAYGNPVCSIDIAAALQRLLSL